MRHRLWKRTAFLVACFVAHGCIAVERQPLMRRADQRSRQPEPIARQSASAVSELPQVDQLATQPEPDLKERATALLELPQDPAPGAAVLPAHGIVERMWRGKTDREANFAKLANLAKRRAEAELKLARVKEELQAIAYEERSVLASLEEQFGEMHEVLSVYRTDHSEAMNQPSEIGLMQPAQAQLPDTGSLLQMQSQQESGVLSADGGSQKLLTRASKHHEAAIHTTTHEPHTLSMLQRAGRTILPGTHGNSSTPGVRKTSSPRILRSGKVSGSMAIGKSGVHEVLTDTALPSASAAAGEFAKADFMEQRQGQAPTTTGALPAATTTRAPANNKSRFIPFYEFALALILGIALILSVALLIRTYRAKACSDRLADSTYWRSAKARQRNRLSARSPTASTIRIDSREVGQSSDAGN